MAPEETPSTLSKLVPGLSIFALVVMILAAIYHVVTLEPPEAPAFSRADAPEAPNYAEDKAWLFKPADVNRAGGWEKPWGIDLIWYSDRPDGYLSGWNIPFDWATGGNPVIRDSWLTSGTNPLLNVFAPTRRFAVDLNGEAGDRSAASDLEEEDILAAADEYFQSAQIMRGFFTGGRGLGLQAAAKVYDLRVNGDDLNSELFGGVIIAPNETTKIPEAFGSLKFCETDEIDFPCVLDLRTASSDEDAQKRLATVVGAFSAWLDGNVAKPAAPLPPMEVIEFAPIHKPGETAEN